MSPELTQTLLELLDDQARMITQLVNENVEQENVINALMREEF